MLMCSALIRLLIDRTFLLAPLHLSSWVRSDPGLDLPRPGRSPVLTPAAGLDLARPRAQDRRMDTPGRLLPLPSALHQRAGDLERNAVCDQLAAHFAAGRLRADELDARLEAAMAAPTLLELRHLLSDLPAAAPVPGRPVPRPVRRWSASDVLAGLTLAAALAFAGLAVLVLGIAGQGLLLAAGFFGGLIAAAGGGALVHLLRGDRDRTGDTALTAAPPQGQRPRIA
jgi:hypothetical protein